MLFWNFSTCVTAALLTMRSLFCSSVWVLDYFSVESPSLPSLICFETTFLLLIFGLLLAFSKSAILWPGFWELPYRLLVDRGNWIRDLFLRDCSSSVWIVGRLWVSPCDCTCLALMIFGCRLGSYGFFLMASRFTLGVCFFGWTMTCSLCLDCDLLLLSFSLN